MINRSAIILRWKAPAIQWLQKTCGESEQTPCGNEDVNESRTVYLVPEEIAETSDGLQRFIRRNFPPLFENELNEWHTDPDGWPANRDFKMFSEWFELSFHEIILDTVDAPLYDDEVEDDE